MLFLSVLLTFFSAASAEDCSYDGYDGECKPISQCTAEGKAYVTGLCQGDNTIRCCLTKNGKPPECDNGAGVKGSCVIESTCAGGQLFSGKCPNYPGDVRCCTGGPHGAGLPRPVPTASAASGGWLTAIEGFAVERIDARSRLRYFSNHRSPVNKFLLHTIEGGGPPFNGYWEGGRATLDSRSFWPHFIVARDSSGRMRVGQFISMSVEGKACRNPGNSVGTIQVEVGGRAAQPFTDYPEIWEPVRALFQAVRREFPAIINGISPGIRFAGDAEAYGTGAAVRIQSESRIRAISGLVGHQHMPSNTHWDPGAIDYRKLTCENRLCSATPTGGVPPNNDGPADPNPNGNGNPNDDDMPGEDIDTNAPDCTANGRSGKCKNTGICRQAGGTPFRNNPPVISGCGHIADLDVQCCDPGAAAQPQAPAGQPAAQPQVPAAQPQAPAAQPQPSGEPCTAYGTAGTCVATATCRASGGGRNSFPTQSGVSGCGHIRSADIQCCAAADQASGAGPVSSGAGEGCSGYSGLLFPLAAGSLQEISVNWGFSRSSGRRCHSGVDIYTRGARSVVAVDDGEVVAVMRNWYPCSRGTIDAIMVYHTTGPLAGKTINYGEINPGTYSVRAGSTVRQGESLGTAANCGMLHFELYQGRRTANSRWYPRGSVGAGCAVTSLSTKPPETLDPRPLLRCTRPSGANFRHGVSFLSEPTDEQLSLFEQDSLMDGEGDEEFDSGLSGGAIAGIILAVLFCIVLSAMLAYYVVIVRTRDTGRGEVTIQNELSMEYIHQADTVGEAVQSTLGSYEQSTMAATYDQPGEFSCNVCEKTYAYADDLQKHYELRH